MYTSFVLFIPVSNPIKAVEVLLTLSMKKMNGIVTSGAQGPAKKKTPPTLQFYT